MGFIGRRAARFVGRRRRLGSGGGAERGRELSVIVQSRVAAVGA